MRIDIARATRSCRAWLTLGLPMVHQWARWLLALWVGLVWGQGAAQAALIAQVAAGHEHSLAITADGMLWAWGRNQNDQFGSPDASIVVRPVAVGRGFA